MWTIEEILAAEDLTREVGPRDPAECVGNHNLPHHDCDTLYGSPIQSSSTNLAEQADSPRSPCYTEVEDPKTGSYLPRPVEE